MTKVTEGRRKKGSEAEEEKGPSVEEKASEHVKKGTAEGEAVGAEAPETLPEEQEGKRMPKSEEEQEVQETEASDAESDAGRAEVSLEERVEQLVKENEELQEKYVRLMADFDNYRKRANKEKSDVIQFGNEGLLKEFLPIIDNIERLLTYSYREGSWKSFQEGIELLLTEISKTLEKYGVEPIEALGKPFDPNIHQAMQRAETEEAEANTVVEVYQKGYLYRGRLLRPSLVVVAVHPKGAEEGGGEEDTQGKDEPRVETGEAGEEGNNEETPIN